ncbi:MAG: DUF4965 domain-containing protein [Chlorobia bacterium]|nr:DUF4965 domain-containing protein [Fimbriimonadaceae bacterium]
MLATFAAVLTMSPVTFRPPAIPLIAHDPFFSVWSFNDKLTDGWTKHWTGATQALCGLVRIDGKTFRWAGSPGGNWPALNQTECRVEATTTHYTFEGSGVQLKVKFTSPALAEDLIALSTPVAYVRFSWEAADTKAHKVEVYMDATSEWVVDKVDQKVQWGRVKIAGIEALRMGTQDQKTLNRSGDDHRIDWGYLYMIPPAGAKSALSSDSECRGSFFKDGTLPTSDDLAMPRPANRNWPVLSSAFDLKAGEEKYVAMAYDDIDSLEWLRRPVPSYARYHLGSFENVIQNALQNYPKWLKESEVLDSRIRKETSERGGPEFADLAVLSYRQAFAAHKIVADIDGKPMMFSKENFSNGCIGTVDVLYPAAPIMLWLNPELLEANLRPLMIYSATPRWRFPFAPHDLGQYPLANGQVYGGGERTEENQMPVEECGNMLILVAALVESKGSKEFAKEYLPIFDKWATYLLEKGLDPDNQLCTDDFAGHLAHNANLSLKAIVGLGSYAKMRATLLGKTDSRATKVRAEAEKMAKEWVKMADDGDHFRLAFDKPGTWSQKYNLVWDKVLKLNLFPKEIYQKELAFYAKKMAKYGLPLDNRSTYTKLDWCVWTACLSDSRVEFDKHVSPLWKWANETSSRVPMTDWFHTHDGKMSGFQARSVVGGVFMPMLVN